MKHKKLFIILCSLLLILAGAILGILIYKNYLNKNNLIPADISKKITFTVFGPETSKNSSGWQIDSKKISYDSNTGILSLQANKDDKTITINQQAEPEAFNDIPTQYSRMLSLLNEYGQIDTQVGTITLTKPKELNGKQSAVLRKNGTLLFAQSSKDLTNDEWKNIFNDFVLLN